MKSDTSPPPPINFLPANLRDHLQESCKKGDKANELHFANVKYYSSVLHGATSLWVVHQGVTGNKTVAVDPKT